MPNKVLGYLGLAAAARKIATGETAYKMITAKKAKVVFLATDCSQRTQERITHVCEVCGVPCIHVYSSEELSSTIGQVNRMSVAVVDQGLAKQILQHRK